MELKLLTLNLHSCQEENQIEKLERVATEIINNDIDIIAFQEVSQHKDSAIAYDDLRLDNTALIILDLLKKADDKYNLYWDWSHYGFGVYEEGLAIISKHPIINTESRYISRTKSINNWKSRKIVKTTLKIDYKNIDVFSCHTGWFNDLEEPLYHQMFNLNQFIYENDNTSIIMGDFNTPDFSLGYELIKSYGLYDLYKKEKNKNFGTIIGKIAGWEENKEELRIDYIFSNKDLKIIESDILFRDNPVSDHMGVITKVII